MGKLGSAIAFAFLAASRGAAQTIQVRTIEAETGRPISGAIVVLLDSLGRRLKQGLTDDFGRISLIAPTAGAYRLKADRIGHPGVVGASFSSAETRVITLKMPARRYVLPELVVSESSACGRGESDETAVLWGEIRKALTASEITSTSEAVLLQVRRFVRRRTLSGVLRSDSTTQTFSTRLAPFVIPDPESLIADGYIQSIDGSYRFFGPDAAFLGSDGFLETHCFRIVRGDRTRPDLIGLGFEPTKGRDVPEIKGTMWVDRESAELRTLEYEYVNVPRSVQSRDLGGRIDFERMVNGLWIVRDWYIRLPNRVYVQRRVGARFPIGERGDTIVGFIEDGGTARPVGDASVLIQNPEARTSRTSLTLRDVRLSIVSNAGTPIVGALVAIAGMDSSLRSGLDGRVLMQGIPTRQARLRIRAIGYAPQSVVISLPEDQRQFDTTVTLTSQAQQLDRIVVNERSEPVRSGKMSGFERRRKEGFGRFLTVQDLANPLLGSLDKQLRRFGRIHLAYCNDGYSAAALGMQAPANSMAVCNGSLAALCFMSVYLDGALYYSASMPGAPFDMSRFPIHQLQGVEVYRSPAEMPPEYNATGSLCGVVLLWTK